MTLRSVSTMGEVSNRLHSLLFAVCLLAFGAVPLRAQTQADFLDDTVLQDVHLTISDRYWQTLKANYLENTYYTADLTWKGIKVRNVGIRSRGGGSRSPIKPGLRVDINRYVANQEFLGLKAFELKNMDTDPSMLRETVAMKLFAQAGMLTPREAHARLFINDQYAGVYVIVEPIDRTFITRVFGQAEGRDDTGGYLFEYKYAFPYNFAYLGPALESYAPLFEPQTHETAAISVLYDPLEEMIRAINESSDQDFAAAVGKFLDVPELMRYLAVELFTVEWDGITGNWETNNFYLYRFAQTGRATLIPKDRDHAFTWDDVPGDENDYVAAPITYRMDTNVLARRATANPGLFQTFLDTLATLTSFAQAPAANDPRPWLEREVDREWTQIAAAIAADPVYPFSADTVQTDVSFLLQFARTRPAVVSCQVAQKESGSTDSECRPAE